ncbi:MAG: heme lyase CcmF/NrfE family subunit [Chloroflexi bacterium]|nr:heme lyase CcmF/NrfE family subunit [Chloroflexota bacterium]
MTDFAMADLGYAALLLSLILSIYAAAAAFYAARRNLSHVFASAKNAVFVVAALTTLAVGVLEWALITHQFGFTYVAIETSRAQPLLYNISALWGGQEGSLLFWAWLLALFTAVVLIQNDNKNRELLPYVVTGLALSEAFFLALLTIAADPTQAGLFLALPLNSTLANALVGNPFRTLDFTPIDGNGLNPLLQNPGMFIHPITQYVGYVAFTVPFAFAMAALFTGRLSDVWIRTTRRWTLFAWLFLSLGLLFGMQWAYVELGWGGYWSWDAVENSSLMPWLTGTAFLHSVMIQERRGMLKVWNLVLVMLTFVLSILGTFITRSGVIESVHAFGVSSLGPWFLAFLAVTLLAFLYLLFNRMDHLKEENELDSLISRESSFLLNNLILVGAAFATLWGTIFPMVSEAITGKKVTVGAPFFNQVNGPIFLALIVLIGICPLIGWRRATGENLLRNLLRPVLVGLVTAVALVAVGVRQWYGVVAFSAAAFVLTTIVFEFYRGIVARRRQYGENPASAVVNLVTNNRRRYGGYIVHIGVIFAVIGIAGSSFYQVDTQANLAPGQTVQLNQYTIQFDGLQTYPTENHEVVNAQLTILSNGSRIGSMSPEKDYYVGATPDQSQSTTEVAVRSTPLEDLYIILAGFDSNTGSATLKVIVNPLVSWLWVGFGVLVAGTLLAAWPDPRDEHALVRARVKEALAHA